MSEPLRPTNLWSTYEFQPLLDFLEPTLLSGQDRANAASDGQRACGRFAAPAAPVPLGVGVMKGLE